MTDNTPTENAPSGGAPDATPKPTISDAKPERTYPLVPFAGAKPPAPAWFAEALAAPHEDASIDVNGAPILWRSWRDSGSDSESTTGSTSGGERRGDDSAKRGLIFVHGGVAHLGWWDFIAPAFTDDWSPVALSLSGMGGSGWRDAYPMDGYADEVAAVAQEAGLFDHAEPPIIVGHSFGGFVALAAAVLHGERFAGSVICDSPIREQSSGGPRTPPTKRGGRVYADDAAALARFRLMPSQDCENLFLVDHVARTALQDTTGDDGAPGRTWRHDPNLWMKMVYASTSPVEAVGQAKCPLAYVRGANSSLVTDERWAAMGETAGPDVPRITLPDAQHHLLLDQPLAFTAALRDLLAGWPT